MSDDIGRNSNKWLNASRSRRHYLKMGGTYQANRIITKKEQEDRIESRKKLHGNGKYTDIGIIARIFNYYLIYYKHNITINYEYCVNKKRKYNEKRNKNHYINLIKNDKYLLFFLMIEYLLKP